MYKIKTAIALTLSASISSCGSYVPDLQDFYQPKDAERLKVAQLVDYLNCEVKTAVQDVLLEDQDLSAIRKMTPLKQGEVLGWLKTWAAQITLTLTVDEKSTLNPGVAFNAVYPNAVSTFAGHPSVMTPQSFSFGLAGAFSTDATRKETLSLYLDFKGFTDDAQLANARAVNLSGHKLKCNELDGVAIESDIKFKNWLEDATLPAAEENGASGNYSGALKTEAKVSKKDVLSHEVTFTVIYGGNVTPTWKLVNFSGNQGSSPLFGIQRTNTQDVIITLGPGAGGDQLSTAAQNTILASQIGIAVANAIRNTQ